MRIRLDRATEQQSLSRTPGNTKSEEEVGAKAWQQRRPKFSNKICQIELKPKEHRPIVLDKKKVLESRNSTKKFNPIYKWLQRSESEDQS